MNRLTLICGLPNSGKTTYSNGYDNVIHMDDIGSMRKSNKLASMSKEDVVVEGIYNTFLERKRILDICADKSPKICIWLDTPVEECIKREKKYRERPIWMVTQHYERFEAPTLDEGWDEIHRIWQL